MKTIDLTEYFKENEMFTRGPWEQKVDGDQIDIWGNNGNQTVCMLDYNGEETKANAQLIAAAPDLYEACKQLISAFDGDTDCTDMLDMIGNKDSIVRQALAKAEGLTK